MFLRLTVVLFITGISGFLLALPSSATAGGVDYTTVTVQGWRAFVPDSVDAKAANETIYVSGAVRSSRQCLRLCIILNSRCRLVSYDLNNQSCIGFTGRLDVHDFGMRRDIDAVLVASTDKVMYEVPGEGNYYPGDDIWAGVGGYRYLNHVPSALVCRDLCLVHPRCNHAEFYYDVCWLKSKTTWDQMYSVKTHISYIS